MTIEYKIKGITLNDYDLMEINRYYEAACTAEYILDTYPEIKTKEEAMELGYAVRELMDKYGYNEEEAVNEVMTEGEFNYD